MSANFGGDDGRKDPAEIEREIEATRADVGDTLDALQAKLSPGQLLDQGLRYMRGGGGQFVGNLGATMRDNPVPVILTGIGIAWMMMASRNPPVPRYGTLEPYPSDAYAADLEAAEGPGMTDRLREKAGAIKDRVAGAASSASHRASSIGSSISDRASSVSSSVSGMASATSDRLGSAAGSARDAAGAAAERARIAPDRARWQAQRTRDQFSRMMDEQPLVVGAMGVALGALIGALVPATEAENQLMGDTRDRLVGTAKAAAEGAKQAIDETIRTDGGAGGSGATSAGTTSPGASSDVGATGTGGTYGTASGYASSGSARAGYDGAGTGYGTSPQSSQPRTSAGTDTPSGLGSVIDPDSKPRA